MNDVKENVHKATAALDDKLVPILGPAPLGPYGLDERDDPHPGPADLLCPVCHHAMSRHATEVDPVAHHTFVTCPELGTSYEVEAHDHDHAPGTLDHPVLN
ncbi:hypothetical protein [Gryllotalpicola koreensis]